VAELAVSVEVVTLRAARPEDNAQIAAIWNHEVAETDATTDSEPRDAAAQRAWLERHGGDYPAIVAVAGGRVVAFGALQPYRPKPSFAHTVEDSVYVAPGCRGRGVGALVLAELIRRARAAGHRSVIARITAPNARSLALHRAAGFAQVGVEREVAHKRGRWLDVVVMQLLLARASPFRAGAAEI
jgi:phosphinothricin acetyltransferase